MVLDGLKPERVFYYFERLCGIPHGSGNCKAISEYCISVAEQLGLEYITDEHHNVIIKKEASNGYESSKSVILQGHLDMVCEKENDCNIDFLTDGLELKVSGDLVSANGTTLGADNGIAVAMVLAILEDNSLEHPAIEALFTTDEETGMFGAIGLNPANLQGRALINIDSENEGVFTVGCAGGARAEIGLNLGKEAVSGKFYKIRISGLIGGHSGAEIDKGRLNANIVLGNFLNSLTFDFNIISIDGGLKDNAIPRESECIICYNGDLNLSEIATAYADEIRVETDNKLSITVMQTTASVDGFSIADSNTIVKLLCDVPNGIQAMSEDIEGLVETSLNLGILKTTDCGVHISFAVRSAKNICKEELLKKLKAIAENHGGEYADYGHYPAWEYRKDSPLIDKMVSVYKAMYSKDPVVETIHAGLECGILSDKLQNLDAVSIGPDMWDIHTPRERISVSSVERLYEFLIKLLSSM